MGDHYETYSTTEDDEQRKCPKMALKLLFLFKTNSFMFKCFCLSRERGRTLDFGFWIFHDQK